MSELVITREITVMDCIADIQTYLQYSTSFIDAQTSNRVPYQPIPGMFDEAFRNMIGAPSTLNTHAKNYIDLILHTGVLKTERPSNPDTLKVVYEFGSSTVLNGIPRSFTMDLEQEVLKNNTSVLRIYNADIVLLPGYSGVLFITDTDCKYYMRKDGQIAVYHLDKNYSDLRVNELDGVLTKHMSGVLNREVSSVKEWATDILKESLLGKINLLLSWFESFTELCDTIEKKRPVQGLYLERLIKMTELGPEVDSDLPGYVIREFDQIKELDKALDGLIIAESINGGNFYTSAGKKPALTELRELSRLVKSVDQMKDGIDEDITFSFFKDGRSVASLGNRSGVTCEKVYRAYLTEDDIKVYQLPYLDIDVESMNLVHSKMVGDVKCGEPFSYTEVKAFRFNKTNFHVKPIHGYISLLSDLEKALKSVTEQLKRDTAIPETTQD